MVGMGHSRWFVSVSRKNERGGYVRYDASVVPNARRYRILALSAGGEPFPREVCLRPCRVSEKLDAYDASARADMEVASRLSRELSIELVGECLAAGILTSRIDKAALIHVANRLIIQCFQGGLSEEAEPEDMLDLYPDMLEALERRRVEEAEHARLAEEEYRRHAAEASYRRALSKAGFAKSFELLSAFLSESEKEEARSRGTVTVRNTYGEFRVPMSEHAFVEQYVGDMYKASYCVVFKDWSIPLGDEVLMKVALLKACPKRFFDVANKFLNSQNRFGTDMYRDMVK